MKPSDSAPSAANLLTCTCCTPNAMHKQLGLGREVKVDDIVQQWDINAAGCHISDHHYVRPPCGKLADMDFTRSLQVAGSMMSTAQLCSPKGHQSNHNKGSLHFRSQAHEH